MWNFSKIIQQIATHIKQFFPFKACFNYCIMYCTVLGRYQVIQASYSTTRRIWNQLSPQAPRAAKFQLKIAVTTCASGHFQIKKKDPTILWQVDKYQGSLHKNLRSESLFSIGVQTQSHFISWKNIYLFLNLDDTKENHNCSLFINDWLYGI